MSFIFLLVGFVHSSCCGLLDLALSTEECNTKHEHAQQMLPLVIALRCWMLLPSFLLPLAVFLRRCSWLHCCCIVDLDVGHDAALLLTMLMLVTGNAV